jgi:site-specific DNA-methyltransferase (adenine-specific)
MIVMLEKATAQLDLFDKLQPENSTPVFLRNRPQRGDALELLRSLPDACLPLGVLDPQFREVLDRQQYGNEGIGRQRKRAELPAMSGDSIDALCHEFLRVLRPSGYLLRWMDTFALVEGVHLRLGDQLKRVGLCSWDSLQLGMGYRLRRRGDYLLVLQRPPIKAKATWSDHGISDRWSEKVDRKVHPHIKPIGLITRLIGATTKPGDLVCDPAAGSFTTMRAALELGREFVGCDITWSPRVVDGVAP